MGAISLFILFPLSVIVNDLDIIGVAVKPLKANSPWVVDPYAPLPGSVAFKLLKPVRRRYVQKVQTCGAMNLSQLPERCPLNLGGKPGGMLPAKDLLCFFTPECLDHDPILTECVSIVNASVFTPVDHNKSALFLSGTAGKVYA